MSIETIYIDASEEITAVIERLKGSHEPIVALVVPRGATLTQSIVNLKLVKRAAQDAGKDVILVTTDKIGRNLATQVGLPVANSEKEIGTVARGEAQAGDDEANVIAGVRIHRYYDEDKPEGSPEETVIPVIVPKELMQSEPPPVPVPVPAPPLPEEVMEAPLPPTSIATSADEVVVAPLTVTPPTKAKATSTTITRTSIDEKPSDEATPVATQDVKPIPVLVVKPPRKRLLIGIASALVLLLVALAAISFLFLPISKVILTVQASGWEQDFSFAARPEQASVSEDGLVLPAESIKEEDEVTLTFKATGTKKVGTAAAGSATIYNYGSTSTQSVPSGTTVVASGKSFTTQEAITVPGYTQAGIGQPLIPGSAKVSVTANEPGADGNMTDAAITGTIAGNANLSGKLTAAGGSSQDIVIITPTDVTNAKNEASQQLRTNLEQKVADRLTGRSISFAENADIYSLGDYTTTQPSGAEVAEAKATLKGSLERIVADQAIIKGAVETNLGKLDTPSEERLIEDVQITGVALNPADKTLAITTHAVGKLTPVFAITDLPEQIKGKDLAAAQSFLSETTPATSTTIEQSPTWWPLKRLPTFAKFITVETRYE